MSNTVVITAIHVGRRKKVEFQSDRTRAIERRLALDSFENLDRLDSLRGHFGMCEVDGETEKRWERAGHPAIEHHERFAPRVICKWDNMCFDSMNTITERRTPSWVSIPMVDTRWHVQMEQCESMDVIKESVTQER